MNLDVRRPRWAPRRLGRGSTHSRRFAFVLASFALLMSSVANLAPLPVISPVETASANHTDIKLPVPGGETWYVSQGYNTNPANGGSHYSCNPSTLKDQPSGTVSCSAYWQYKYSLDLHASSGETTGRTVLSPVNGTIRWIDEAYGGMSIDLGDGYAFAFFHVELASNLAAGQTITQGQFIGTVAAPGNRGNGGYAHIHVTLWRTTDGGNWSRIPEPFTGDHAIDGVSLPALADSSVNQYQGRSITSSNSAAPSPSATVPDVPQLTSPANGTTYATSPQVVNLAWTAETGATSYQVVINDGAITSPWVSTTTWTTSALSSGQYAWQVRARNSSGQSALSAKLVFWVDPGSGSGAPTPGTTPGALATRLQTTSGTPGSSTYAQGAGMTAGETVDLFWDSTSGTKLNTTTANSAGNWVASVQIPNATGGVHKVVAKGKTSGKSASANFTVTPKLERSPYSAAPGTTISVTIRGFGASESVSFVFYHTGSSTATLTSITTNSSGTASVTFPMPEAAVGPHDYKVTGASSGISAWGELSILPSVTLSSTQGASGASVTATAKGFAGSSTIRFAWNQSTSTQGTTLCSTTTSSRGNATCSFTVPSSSAGAYPVVATTSDGSTGSAQFGVAGAASISLTPSSGTVGAPVQISIGGFQANETIRLTIDGSTSPWQSVTAGSTGAALVPSTIPFLTQGSHTIQARGLTSGKTDSATLTVQPSMSVSPSGGAPGTRVTAYVRGMKASQSVNVRFNSTSPSTGTSVCSGTTANDGSYTCSFNVPNVSGKTYSVYAGSSAASATTNYAVTTAGEVSGGVVIGEGTYQVTATQEGLVGGTTSNGHVIVANDHFVALPACTPANCNWLSPGQTSATYGYVANCSPSSTCFVRVTNPATGACRVEPIWDTGPWFTNDNWWDPAELRNLNNLSTTVNILPQGYAGADAARDGLNVGYGTSNGIGISNVGYQTGNRAAIDIADGTWQDIGFSNGAGPKTVVVSMLWQTGEDVDAARAACLGEDPAPTPDGSITIDPGYGGSGESVAVTGSGFASGESVGVYWNSTNSGSPLRTVTTSSTGGFSTTITVPNADPGKHLIAAAGSTSGEKASRSYVLLATPSISIAPLSGPNGTRVAVTGSGYTPSEQVQIYWDSTGSSGTLLTTVTADSLGEFTASITTPNDSAGRHLIVGKGVTSGVKPSRSFTVEEAISPAISINITSGPAGTVVPITGEGYTPGETVDIRWDRSSGSILKTVTASSSGTFSTSATVPDDENGKHLFVGVGRTSGAKPSRSFTIVEELNPSISITTTSGPSGTVVPITGQGYLPGEVVDIRWDRSSGTVLTTVTANGSGAFSTQATVPDDDAGKHLFVGVGRTSGAKPSRSFTIVEEVDPSISITTTSGPGGTVVPITGQGYAPGETVDIRWDRSTGIILKTVTASGSGTFSTSATVPDASPGKHLFVGVGRTSGAKPSRSFNVIDITPVDPSISIDPTSGRTATTVAVTGAGYTPNEAVEIYFDSTGSTGTLLTTTTASGSGTFSTTVTIPHTPGGSHLIVGKGVTSGVKPSRTFTITQSVSLSAGSATPGETVRVTLRGFHPGEPITLTWDHVDGLPLASVTANSTGSAAASFTVPSGVNGTHRVVATGSVTAGLATADLTVTDGNTAAATVTVSPNAAIPTASLTVNGANFWAQEEVQVFWDDNASPSGTATTGYEGSGSLTISVPTMPGGSHTLTMRGVTSGKTATTTFTVQPRLLLTPASGGVGDRIVADVKGWSPGVEATIYYNRSGSSGGTAVCSASGRASGTASCSFTIPNGATIGTEIPITATGDFGTVSTTLTITASTASVASESVSEPPPTAEASPAPEGTPAAAESATPEATETAPAEPTEAPVEATGTEEPMEEPTEVATEAPAEAPTEGVTEEPAQEPTPVPTEAPTEVPAEEPTEVPTEIPTEEPTEVPTEEPTQVPTEEPTPEPTLAPEPRAVTAYVVSDATTFSARPDETGPAEVLNAGGPDGAVAYVTFSVEGIGAGIVTDAYLVLTGGGEGAGGSTVYAVPGMWVDEASATYNTLPSQGLTPAVDASGNAVYLPYIGWGEESWINVAGSIYGDGTITFVITGTPDAIASLTSRESGVPARLEITVQD